MKKHIRYLIAATCALAVLFIAARLIWPDLLSGGRDRNPSNQLAGNRPVELPTGDYVGSAICGSCHAGQHAAWHDSYHRTMTQVPSPQSVVGDFDNVRLSGTDLDVRLFKQGSAFMAELSFRNPSETKVFPVVLTTGSHHQQWYWLASPNGPEMMILPYVYLTDEKRWIPRHTVLLNARLSVQERPEIAVFHVEFDAWKTTCISCHTTHGQPQPADQAGSVSALARVAEFGISCEACHGPGAAHVRANSDTRAGDAGSRTGIINPAKLAHDRSSGVCGQCHSVFVHRSDEAHKNWLHNGYSYRPGDDLFADPIRFLTRGRPELMPDRPADAPDPVHSGSFWSDGMSRATGREFSGTMESPCYKRGKMSCLSCHAMHQKDGDRRTRKEWAAGQLKPGMDGNRACVQCHDPFKDAGQLTRHTHHAAHSTGSKCYNCHMPHTTYGLLKAARSHQVSSPSVAESVQTGRPNACNQCHQDRTLAWAANQLALWYKQPKPKLSADEEQIAATVLWALRGDAGQRAIMAWSFGWSGAHPVSGNNWQAPFLAALLNDPYPAVRFIAHRSLKRLPGFADFSYDFVGSPAMLAAASQRARQVWERSHNGVQRPFGRQRLIDSRGCVVDSDFQRLLKLRDDRPVIIAE
jgi:hypothetical protein